MWRETNGKRKNKPFGMRKNRIFFSGAMVYFSIFFFSFYVEIFRLFEVLR